MTWPSRVQQLGLVCLLAALAALALVRACRQEDADAHGRGEPGLSASELARG